MYIHATPAPERPQELKYIPQLDGVRACAILAVLLYHSPLHLKGAWMGVDLFFVLSGFLITRILLDQKDKAIGEYFAHFYSRRARRTLPAYVLSLVVATVFFGFAWMRHWPFYLGFMNIAHPAPEGLTVLWSLAVEEQFYLIWPFVILFVKRRWLPYFALAMIIAAPTLRGLFTPILAGKATWAIYNLTPFRMDCLATGALIGIMHGRWNSKIAKVGIAWLAPTFAALVTLFYLFRQGGFSTFDFTVGGNVLTYELSLIACTGVFLWALSGKMVGVLKLKPIRWIGRLSYSLYLIHLTAFQFFGEKLGNRLAFPVAMVFCLTYVSLSWKFVEGPFLQMRRPGSGTPNSKTSAKSRAWTPAPDATASNET